MKKQEDLASLTVQELMGSLKSFEQRTSRQSEKPVEAAFQSKLNISNSKQGESSTNIQFRGGQESEK